MSNRNRGVPLDDWQRARDADVRGRAARREAFKRPLTATHKKYLAEIRKNVITICVGPAGTGKTSLACQAAAKLVREGDADRVVLTRPLVECDGQLGILPGGVEEKMALFVAPMVEALKKAMGAAEYERLKAADGVQIVPLEQMRGKTFDRAVVVIDEPQNATFRQLHMALTRIGHDSRVVVCGDLRQSDLRGDAPLLRVAVTLKRLRHPQIGVVVMHKEDVLRPDIVSVVDEALSECDWNPTSGTITTTPSTDAAPSYGEWPRTPDHPSPNSSKS